MMKAILITITIILSCTLIHAQKFMKAPDDKALVYFVRTNSVGSSINFKYFDGKEYLGKFNGKGYLVHECDTGKHLFWAASENIDFIEANIEAGKTYVIIAEAKMGAIKAALQLSILNFSNEKDVKTVGKVVGDEPPIFFSSADITEEQNDYNDLIGKGINKYQEQIAKGIDFPTIIPGMEVPNEYIADKKNESEFLKF